ncbi:hypothetical protein H8N03_14830 [Ramlibacter sp. USB13]|uniref:PLL-like beta propeller domain-containing protein n=1 Tax=Ramlibacter cellulosilyticus TaxID=2764187 RepID=A0A923SBU7_9BURK|nr:hypothetical protein [Ramlibacter cellulosilyticus]MBC5784224.1 hypothetical protein [Ramlibacter cellulosilyticus]
MPRRRLNDVPPAERQRMVDALFASFSDIYLEDVPAPRPDQTRTFSTQCVSLAEAGDRILRSAGLEGLPAWSSEETIPPEWLVVKARQNGTPRFALATDRPGVAVPEEFVFPLLYHQIAQYGDYAYLTSWPAIPWLEAVWQALCPGAAVGDRVRWAAPILWSWAAWMADKYAEARALIPTVYHSPDPSQGYDRLVCMPAQDRSLQLFLNQVNGRLYMLRQPLAGQAWAPWVALSQAASLMDHVVVVPDAKGIPQAFGNGRDSGIRLCQQDAQGGWSQPDPINEAIPLIAWKASQSDQGRRFDIFGIGTDGKLYNLWQRADGSGWGGWGLVGGAGITKPSMTVTHCADDTVIVLHIGSDAQVWALTQYPGGYCRDPYVIQALPEQKVERVFSALNSGGKLTVLAQTILSGLYCCHSNEADGHWERWDLVDQPVADACMMMAPDQRLVLFTIDPSGVVRCRRQDAVGGRWWTEPQILEGPGGFSNPVMEIDAQGCVQFFAYLHQAGTRGCYWRSVESAPGSNRMLPLRRYL